MRILEDVIVNSSHAPEAYLGQLERHLRRIEKRDEATKGYNLALKKLEEVRLACARNLARAVVLYINDQYAS